MTKKRNNQENVGSVEQITAYKCGFCSKIYQRKHYAEKHTVRCSSNPENNRACFTCQFNEHRVEDLWCEPIEDRSIKVNVSYCSKINCFIYPPITEFKNNAFEFGDIDNVPMRKECEHYKSGLIVDILNADNR